MWGMTSIGKNFCKGVEGWGFYSTARIDTRQYETVIFRIDLDALVESMHEDEDFLTELGCGEDESVEDFLTRFGQEKFKDTVEDAMESGRLDEFLANWGSDMCEPYYECLEEYKSEKKAIKGHDKWCCL